MIGPEVPTLLLHCCALRKFHMTDGQSMHDQITRGRRSRRLWSFFCIPFILSGSPNECWLHTCHARVITTWRLGLRTPIVSHNYYSFKIFLHFWLAKIPQIIIIITSYCWPKFFHYLITEEFCNMWKVMSILQHNHKKTGKLTKKTWGRGWVVFGKEYKIEEHLTHFAWKKWVNYWLKT